MAERYAWTSSQSRTSSGKRAPMAAVVEHVADAVGEVGPDRDPRPPVGRDPRRLRCRVDDEVDVLDLLDLEDQAGEEEGVAGLRVAA